MIHAAEVLERLVRDVEIVIKSFSLSPTDNLHSILGDGADWKSEPGSLSEVAHFAELIAERRAGRPGQRVVDVAGVDQLANELALLGHTRQGREQCE